MSDQKRKPGFFSLERIVNATMYSIQGIQAAWQNETAFKQELVLSIFLIPMSLWLGEGGVEQALMLGVTLQVLLVEILNSAIESVVDRFGGERHPLSKRAKDMASAAVLFSLIIWVCVWGLILYDKFV